MYKELMEYDDFINICEIKDLLIQSNFRQETENSDKYYELVAIDGNIRYECHLNSIDTSTGLADFESNYLSSSNNKISQRMRFETSSERQDVRIRQVHGDLRRTFVYATMSSTGSLDAMDEAEYSISCPESTHTFVDFHPSYNYALTGGSIKLLSTPTAPIKVSFIIAPDIPAEYGGNWPIVQNKKLIEKGDTFTEKVDSKFFKYRPEAPTSNKTRVHIDHVEGENAEIEFCLEVFI